MGKVPLENRHTGQQKHGARAKFQATGQNWTSGCCCHLLRFVRFGVVERSHLASKVLLCLEDPELQKHVHIDARTHLCIYISTYHILVHLQMGVLSLMCLGSYGGISWQARPSNIDQARRLHSIKIRSVSNSCGAKGACPPLSGSLTKLPRVHELKAKIATGT